MTMKTKKHRKGQALIEFALILPLLLLVIIGIFEFGRALFVYANLFNATREGARYGLTHPQDYNGILQHAQEKVTLVQLDPANHMTVKMDTGPSSSDICTMSVGNTCPDHAVVGNRVLVEITYDLAPMTPLLEPIVSEFNIETEAARTIQRVSSTVSTPPPTAPPSGTDSDSDGLTDDQESDIGTNPNNADSDGDGVPDNVEVGDPNSPTDTDNDGTINANDTDDDGDGISTVDEDVNGDGDPTNDDADGDGIPNYLDTDSDNDGLPDSDETGLGTDPYDGDSDGDGISDGDEVDQGTDPNDPNDPSEPTATPTATLTPTPVSGEPTATPTALEITPAPQAGETIVSGNAQAGELVTLRIVQTGHQVSVVAASDNTFTFTDLPALSGGHTVVVEGYGQQDTAEVQGGTATPEPTPTEQPDSAFYVAPTCGAIGETLVITVTGNGLSTNKIASMKLSWNGDLVQEIPVASDFVETVEVTLVSGENELLFEAYKNKVQVEYQETATVQSPCDEPDLVVSGLSLLNETPLGTYEKIDVEVSVTNQGGADVPSLFWVDLLADQGETPDPLTATSDDYIAVNGLPAGGTIGFTMWVESGFAVTGTHEIVALVDTWDQIMESDDTNNYSTPLTITLTQDNPTPTPTPTPDTVPDDPAKITGVTLIDGVGQSLVNIYIYDQDGRLIWSGQSQTIENEEGQSVDGYYEAELPPGDYTVTGQMRMADALYYGQTTVTALSSGEVRDLVDISLSAVTE